MEGRARALRNSARTPPSPLARTVRGYLFLLREEAKEKTSQTANPRRSRWDPAPAVQKRKLRHGEAEGFGSGRGWAPRASAAGASSRGPFVRRRRGAFFVFRRHHDYGSLPTRWGRTASSGRPLDFSSAWAARNPQGGGAEGRGSGLGGAPERGAAGEGPSDGPAGSRTGRAGWPPSRRTRGHPQARPQSPLRANGRAVQGKPRERSGCGAPEFLSLGGEGRPTPQPSVGPCVPTS